METDEIFTNFNFGEADLPALAAVVLSPGATNEFNKTHLLHPRRFPDPKMVKEVRQFIKACGSMEGFVDALIEKQCFLSEAVRAELSRYLVSVSPISQSLRKKVG